MKDRKKILILGAGFVVLLAVLAGVWYFNRPATAEGSKTITVEVVHKDQSKKSFICTTTEKVLAPVLLSEKIVQDESIEAGMFFIVDGEKTVYEEDKSYWAVYQNGEYASLGINELPIQDGDKISLVYTVYSGG